MIKLNRRRAMRRPAPQCDGLSPKVQRHGPLRTRLRPMLLMMAILPLAGCDREAGQAQTQPQPVRAVSVSVTNYQPVATITGEVQARVQADLAFRVSGKVIERRIDVGAHVKAGDLLLRLDDTEQQADVQIAEASLRAAQADVKQKTLAYQRYRTLLDTQAIAQQVFDQAQQHLATSQATLESAEATLASAKDSLSYTTLRADADGIITARNVEVGSVVSAAQAALTIAHDGPRDAVFNVYEAFFLKGEPSQNVDVWAISAPTQRASAVIRETSPVIDPNTGTIQVKLTLPNEATWPLGTPILGAFLAAQDKGAALPWSAMSSLDGKPAVWVIDKESRTATLRPIKIALYRSGDFIVADGLTPGDLVVTEGGKIIRPNETLTWEG